MFDPRLHADEPAFFWWELIEMAKRFLLVGLMVLAQGNMMQLYAATLVVAALLLFQVQASPFRDMLDDYLASSASFCLLVIFLCGTAFKISALTELEDIRCSVEASVERVCDCFASLA